MSLPWTKNNVIDTSSYDWLLAALSGDGEYIIVARNYGYLYRSSDFGASWTPILPYAALTGNEAWSFVKISEDGSKLFVTPASQYNAARLYTSADYGDSWSERKPVGDTSIQWRDGDMTPDGTILHVAGCYNGSTGQGRFYRSENSGGDWTELQPAGDVDKSWRSISCSDDGSVILAGVFQGRLYVSTNAGEDWDETKPAGSTDNLWTVVSVNADGTKMIAACAPGRMYVSTNYGSSWDELQPAGNVDAAWQVVNIDPTGQRIFVSSAGGFPYTTIDGGANWVTEQPAGVSPANWYAAAADEEQGRFAAGAYGGYFYLATSLPGKATNPDPADDEIDVAVTKTLSWTTGVRTDTFDVYVGLTEESLELVSADQTNNGYDPVLNFADLTEYYWRVDSKNVSGTTTGDVWHFTTVLMPPEKAINPTPANSAVQIELDAILEWEDGGGADTYDVYFGTAPGSLSLVSSDQETLSYTPASTFDYYTVYYWRIDSTNDAGTTTGTVWSFRAKIEPPGKVTDPTPIDTATLVAVDTGLSWIQGTGGTPASYSIYLGLSADSLFLIASGYSAPSTGIPISLIAFATYYWRVDAINASGTATGDVWSFTTTNQSNNYVNPGKLVFQTRYDLYKGQDQELQEFLKRWERDLERDFSEISKRINWLIDNRFNQSE